HTGELPEHGTDGGAPRTDDDDVAHGNSTRGECARLSLPVLQGGKPGMAGRCGHHGGDGGIEGTMGRPRRGVRREGRTEGKRHVRKGERWLPCTFAAAAARSSHG